MKCPYCGGGHILKKGFSYTKYKPAQQRFVCKGCNKNFGDSFQGKNYQEEMPRILLLDIETSLYHVATWGTYKQYIQHYQITEHQYILSWAAKWLFDDKMLSDVVTADESINRDDKRVIDSVWKLLDDADIVIGHNVERFDLRKLKWRFISLGLQPPTPYRIIDTLKETKKEFFAPSYKQDFFTKYFSLQNKLETEFMLWRDCEKGDQEALDKMTDYNQHDVIGLEELYLKIRPYIKNHPNMGVLMDEDCCPNCGSPDLEETEKTYFTAANKFPVYRCTNCKTPYIRHKKNSNTVQTNLRSVPK